MAILEQRETPFGTKPSMIDQPVPGEQEQQDFAAEVAGTPAPDLQAPAEAEVDPLAEFGAPAAEADPLAEFGAAPVAGDPAAEEAAFEGLPFVEQLKTGVRESLARAKVSFGVTDDEKLRAAQSIFPTAVLSGGEIFRKSKTSGNLVPLDEEGFELIDDVLDFSRDVVEGLVESGFVAGGAALGGGAGAAEGAAVGLPAGPIGSAAGAVTGGGLGAVAGGVAGGAAGAAAATTAGDFIQEKLLGIERDPLRQSRKDEAIIATAMGGAFSILGSAVARRKASKQARKATQQKLSGVDAGDAVEEVAHAEEAIKTVQDSGLAKTVNGDILLTPNQLNPSNPTLKAEAKAVLDRPEYGDFLKKQADILTDSYDTIAAAVGNANAKGVGLGTRFVKSIKDINDMEGALIGKFRAEALKKSENLPVPVNRFQEFLTQTAEGMGIDPGKAVDVDKILDNFPDLTEGQAKTLGRQFNKLHNEVLLSPGGLPLKKVDAIYKQLTTQINMLSKGQAGKPLAAKLINIKNSIRDDWTDAIGEQLGAGSREAYQQSLDKFSKVRGASSKLNLLLKNENISQEALGRKLFTGQTSLANIRNVKTIIQSDDPDLWKDLVFNHFSDLKRKHTDPDTLSTNWKALTKEFDKLGSEVKGEIFEGSDFTAKQLDAVLTLGRRTNLGESELRESLQKGVNMQRMKNLFLTLAPVFISTRAQNFQQLMGSFGKDKALAKVLANGGLDEVSKGLPAKVRKILRDRVQPMVDQIASGAKAAGRTESRIQARENQEGTPVGAEQ